MDSRVIPALLVVGWLLLTLGIWGACGRPWWLWPVSAGIGLLGTGAGYGWALWWSFRAKAGKVEPAIDGYENQGWPAA